MDIDDPIAGAIGAVSAAVAFTSGVLDGLVGFLLSLGDPTFLLSGAWFQLLLPAAKYIGPELAPDALPWDLVTAVLAVGLVAVLLYKYR